LASFLALFIDAKLAIQVQAERKKVTDSHGREDVP